MITMEELKQDILKKKADPAQLEYFRKVIQAYEGQPQTLLENINRIMKQKDIQHLQTVMMILND